MSDKLHKYQIYLFLSLWLTLPIFFQNCGDPASGGLWSIGQSSCATSLCNIDGRGDVNKIGLSLNLNNGAVILPLIKPGQSTSSSLYTLSVSGTCTDGGFVRNKVAAHLGTLYKASTNCKNGTFSLQLNITENLVSMQLNDGSTYPSQLEVQVIGIDNFDNEYKVSNGYQKTSVIIKAAPFMSSFAQGTSESWVDYRVFEYSSQILSSNPTVSIGDINGYCKYYGASSTSNNIAVSLKADGTPDSARIQIPNLNLKCQDINNLKFNANQVPYTTGVAYGYSGYFTAATSIFMNYNISGQSAGISWDPTNSLGMYSSRNASIILTQQDPSGYVIETKKRLILKFSSIDTSQGWTIEMLKQAQKQIRRAITLNWDNSLIEDTDVNSFMTTQLYGLRVWILNRLDVNENGDGTFAVSKNNSSNEFHDLMRRVSQGTVRCDPRLNSDMSGWVPSSSGFDVNRIGLCLWYWRRHGVLNHSSLDTVTNWDSTTLVMAIKEGVNRTTCKTLKTAKTIPAAECADLNVYLDEVTCIKNNYGGNDVTFLNAVTQSHLNHIMRIVSRDVVTPFSSGFFNSVLSNIIEPQYFTAPSMTTTLKQQMFPSEVNIGSGGLFSIYALKNEPGSINAQGSYPACINYLTHTSTIY